MSMVQQIAKAATMGVIAVLLTAPVAVAEQGGRYWVPKTTSTGPYWRPSTANPAQYSEPTTTTPAPYAGPITTTQPHILDRSRRIAPGTGDGL